MSAGASSVGPPDTLPPVNVTAGAQEPDSNAALSLLARLALRVPGKPYELFEPLPVGDRLEFHLIAALFPMMSEDEISALGHDIFEHGQREPIVLHDGMILDGRHRYVACTRAGKVPDVVEFTGGDPLAFVISTNLRRRHLIETQRAVIAEKIATRRLGDNQHTGGSANLQTLPQVSVAAAAAMLNVSPRTIGHVRHVQRYGSVEQMADLAAGKTRASAAAAAAGEASNRRKIGRHNYGHISDETRRYRQEALEARQALLLESRRARDLEQENARLLERIADADRVNADLRDKLADADRVIADLRGRIAEMEAAA